MQAYPVGDKVRIVSARCCGIPERYEDQTAVILGNGFQLYIQCEDGTKWWSCGSCVAILSPVAQAMLDLLPTVETPAVRRSIRLVLEEKYGIR